VNSKRQFNVFWDRLSRSTPALGILGSFAQAPARLHRKALEDAYYRTEVTQMGSVPLFPHDSVKLEKEIIAGEVLAHLITLAIAIVIWHIYPDTLSIWLGAWATAFVADSVGGRIAVWNFNRRHPMPEYIPPAKSYDSDSAE
jgi:hypothetical protein